MSVFSTRFLGGLLLAGAACWPGARAQTLQPDAFARLPTLSHPIISPDGQYLALSLHNNDAKWNEADYQLVVFHLPDLKGVSRLNMAPHYQPMQIAWVSDTRLAVSLAYTSGSLEAPQATGEIVAVDYDGGHKQIVYSREHRGDPGSNIHSMEMPLGAAEITGLPRERNGHVFVRLLRGPKRVGQDWDSGSTELYDIDTVSGKPRKLADIDRSDMAFVIHDGVARLAYGMTDDRHMAVFERAAAGGDWQQLPQAVTGEEMTPLAISRDGTRLWSEVSEHGGPAALVVSHLDGTGRKVLASDPFGSVGTVLWNEATGEPYAALIGTGRPRLVYLDDSVPAQVLEALNAKFPDHLVMQAGADAREQRMIVAAVSDRDPGTVAMFDTDGMSLRPLFRMADWIDPARMAERRPFRFKAGDGTELGGFVTLPHGSDGKHLPTVLVPHGGPISISDGWSYDADAQFLANLGYAVVQVNYRGSGGRGPEFQYAGYKHFGDRIQQDLLDGLHWAEQQGYTDPARVCVYGGSFGGYSALMLPILAPGEFKCAIDYAGVSDWTIGFRKSDTSHYKLGRSYFAHAVGDEAAARAISPLYRLDRFNVPVLIAHGEDDPRVPYENATALRAALEKAGKPFEWLSKPKEGHGFYTEADRVDLYRHMQAFLARYLGP